MLQDSACNYPSAGDVVDIVNKSGTKKIDHAELVSAPHTPGEQMTIAHCLA